MAVRDRPAVRVFAMGGTIAAVVGPDGRNASMHLTAEDITATVPQLGAVADIRSVSFRTLPSASLRFADILALAHEIDSAARGGADGIVVTQGTDTLEETAWLLDCVVRSDVPVVVTGAMRNAGKPGPDGPANLLSAVQVAASPLAAGLGTLVVFNDEIHAARFVKKTHSSSTATFRSPGVGPLGWVNEGRVRIPVVPRRRTTVIPLDADRVVPQVALVRLVLDDDGAILSALSGSAHAGLVVEAFGGGHVPSDLVDILGELARGRPVVFVSRTGAGELYTATGSFAGSEQDLLARGLIPGGILDGPKARVLLRVLLAQGSSRERIAAAFDETVH